MKKLFIFLICLVSFSSACFGASAAETPLQNAPYLESITLSNAQIDGGFNPNETYCTVTLDNPAESAVLESYTVNGDANVFATYDYDDANHQTGLVVTLTFANGSVIYTFEYSNPQSYSINSNANLAGLNCEYSEVQPQINASDTSYKLYIPYDLTELTITPVTEDINAYAAPIPLTLREGQETEIPITITASDGSTKKYTFKIIRVDKTVDEVKTEMADPAFVSFVEGEKFYQQPEFIITAGAVAGGAIAVLIIAAIVRRFAVNPYDSQEKEFYSAAE